MHWAPTQFKLNFHLANLYVTFTWSKNYAKRDLLEKILSILIPEHDQTHPSNQTYKVKSKKKAFQALILIRKPKENLPGGESNPGLPCDSGDTHHYITEELGDLGSGLMVYVMGKRSMPL